MQWFYFLDNGNQLDLLDGEYWFYNDLLDK